MKIKLAQYGISHDHASGKARVMQENSDVDSCGSFELTLDIISFGGNQSSWNFT
jgi:hypothetical protein